MRKEIARPMELNATTAVKETTTPKCAETLIANTIQREKERNRVAKTRKKIFHTCHATQDCRLLTKTVSAIDEFDTSNKEINKRVHRTITAIQKATHLTKILRELCST